MTAFSGDRLMPVLLAHTPVAVTRWRRLVWDVNNLNHEEKILYSFRELWRRGCPPKHVVIMSFFPGSTDSPRCCPWCMPGERERISDCAPNRLRFNDSRPRIEVPDQQRLGKWWGVTADKLLNVPFNPGFSCSLRTG